MEKIHIRNLFQLLVPLTVDFGNALTATPRTEPFGVDLGSSQFGLNIRLVGTDYFGNIKHEPTNCFTWARRNAVSVQQAETKSLDVDGILLRLKIEEGVFDFRRIKDRVFQIIVELVENGSVTKTGTSRLMELFPKRRRAQNADDDQESESKYDIL